MFREMVGWLLATLVLGCVLLGIKGYEYYQDFQDKVVPAVNCEAKPGEGPAGELFWLFYWVASALHAIHMPSSRICCFGGYAQEELRPPIMRRLKSLGFIRASSIRSGRFFFPASIW